MEKSVFTKHFEAGRKEQRVGSAVIEGECTLNQYHVVVQEGHGGQLVSLFRCASFTSPMDSMDSYSKQQGLYLTSDMTTNKLLAQRHIHHYSD